MKRSSRLQAKPVRIARGTSPWLTWRTALFVVAAASRSATLFDRPRADSLRLMCSYWRLRFALFTPRGGIRAPPRISYLFDVATAKFGPHGRSLGTLLW